MGFDIAIDELASDGVHGDRTGAVHHAIGDDGLRVDAGQRLGGLVGEHGSLGRHVEGAKTKKEEGRRKNGERRTEEALLLYAPFYTGVDIPREHERNVMKDPM